MAACQSVAEPGQAEIDNCTKQRGYIEYSYNSSGCPVSFNCNLCNALTEAASKNHKLIGFIITSIMGVSAVISGIYLKPIKEVIEWFYSGLVIGGVISIFIGTVSYFGDMGRFLKPFILLLEIVLIVWIAAKTYSDKN